MIPLDLCLVRVAGLDASQVTAASPHVIHQNLTEPVVNAHLAAETVTTGSHPRHSADPVSQSPVHPPADASLVWGVTSRTNRNDFLIIY